MGKRAVVWHGPRTLTQVRQVCIPVELLRELNLDAGDELQFALSVDGDEIRVRPASPDGRARRKKDA
ncbi:AbrB/MazE/SpoVT family DNA-binding domain-containing protein [Plantibacter sp. MCCC 1A11337]|uniref:AbrB/MazE/SpoVT family DNA-binding domain-containing protein n=1 Tax=Plantibacter sp. MCCC 1A11337 TaxID=2736644 RepID=UPI00352E00A6